MKNNRAVGDKFEVRCQQLLNMSGTIASGAAVDDGDLRDDWLIVECKVKNTVKGVNIPPSLIDKVDAQAVKWRRDWAIASRTQAGDFITMPLDAFAEIYSAHKDMRL